ncbi:TetR/AcrR family transcriptional regulator [Amycolatopsis tolypomycina]|nr:TetR/AcrR family transcriptional regulator [Amycolatopsis tolypomycina]
MAAGAELFRRNGYAGTGLKQIVSEANAPFGSLYHFFPGGKQQLGEEVIRTSGLAYIALFDLFITPAEDLVSGIEAFFAAGIATLEATGYVEGCPIATVALEAAATNEPLRQATADVFTAWIDAGTEKFAAFGLSAEAARTLTITAVNNLEGAFVLCRSLRDTEAMAVAGAATVEVAKTLMSR